jgi:hypothetical protein
MFQYCITKKYFNFAEELSDHSESDKDLIENLLTKILFSNENHRHKSESKQLKLALLDVLKEYPNTLFSYYDFSVRFISETSFEVNGVTYLSESFKDSKSRFVVQTSYTYATVEQKYGKTATTFI